MRRGWRVRLPGLAGLAGLPGATTSVERVSQVSEVPDWMRVVAERVHRDDPLAFYAVADSSGLPALPALPETIGAAGMASEASMARRHSAVLLLFGPDAHGGEDVVLTQRASRLRSHPGQVSFPGGAVDERDEVPVRAALREAREEVGLDPGGVQVVAELPERYLPPSGYVVTPVLAWWSAPSPIQVVDAGEVAAVVRVPLAELLDPENRFTVVHPSGHVGPGFAASGLFVWGFTAGLLSHVLDLGGLTRPWDRSRQRVAPQLVPGGGAPGGVPGGGR